MEHHDYGFLNFMIQQNAAILERMYSPPPYDPPGIYENPKGQTIYVDVNGNQHYLHSTNEQLNGWTI
ncbi:hypothetical protein D3Z48_05905 [Clostridiaceae bacterium]|nr:hypothetical protein [Clostridiaceae bacterium]